MNQEEEKIRINRIIFILRIRIGFIVLMTKQAKIENKCNQESNKFVHIN